MKGSALLIELMEKGIKRSLNIVRCAMVVSAIFVALMARAQVPVPPDFCGSMNPDNSFTLSWTTPVGADPDLTYEIFKDDGGGFVSINVQGPPNNTEFTDFGIDPLQMNRYYIRSVLNGTPSGNTEVISNMVLSLDALGEAVAQLSWTLPYDPMPPGDFNVILQIPGGAPEVRAVLPADITTYNDTLSGICDDTLATYYIEFATPQCATQSQRVAEEFVDNVFPPQPLIETALVDPLTGDIIIYWDPVNAPDLDLYRIQDIDVINQQFLNVGTVQAGEPTQFNYAGAGENGEKTLAVIAFDECGNDGSFAGTVTTIFAEADYSECGTDAMVSWTEYEGWSEGVEAYHVKARIDGGAPVVIEELTGEETFYIAEVEPNREYCFFVEAISAGAQRNSTSNQACVITDYPVVSAFLYNSYVTVLDNSSVEVALLQDPAAEGMSYELYRARQTGGFVKIGEFEQTQEERIVYVDTDLDPRNLTYRYRWKAFDGCGVSIGESNIGANMTLTAIAETREFANYLTWTPYEEWENGVARYRIQRKVGLEGEFEDFAELDGQTLVYTDDVEEFQFEEGEFCYRIIAEEAANSFGEASESETVVRCATQPPVMWIPSAMVINGEPDNQVFQPVAAFIDFDTFRMEIYNKWGNRIFESEDVNDGWDGTYKGNEVRSDMYRYIISYSDGSGRPFVEQDVVYVLKK